MTGLRTRLADGDNDTLAALTCADGQVAKRAGSAWVCGNDANSDTLANLACTSGQVARWDAN